MRFLFTNLVLLAALVGLLATGRAQNAKTLPESDNVIERFRVEQEGDALLLPVRFKDKTYSFVVDSGATLNIFEESLMTGEPKKIVTVQGADGPVRVKLFDAPKASLASLSIQTDNPIAAFDFKKIREVSGHGISGILGMSFLRRHVVRIDFDKGELLILKKADGDSGEAVPIKWDRNDNPLLSLDVAGAGKEDFVLDTGAIGSGCGDLRRELFDLVKKNDALTVVGESLIETVSGTGQQRLGRLKQLSLGGFTVRGAIVGDSADNRIGLGFCARFIVTLDFANEKLYLKKGERLTVADTFDRSGLHIIRREGKTLVHSLDKESPAERAGLRTKDQLVKVGDKKVDRLSLFQVRRLFHEEGKTLTLKFERDGKELAVALALGSEQAQQK